MGAPLTQANLAEAQLRGAEPEKEKESPQSPAETCVDDATQSESSTPVTLNMRLVDKTGQKSSTWKTYPNLKDDITGN